MKTDAKITGACAVLFEENCCKSVGTFGDAKKLFVVPRGKNGNCFITIILFQLDDIWLSDPLTGQDGVGMGL